MGCYVNPPSQDKEEWLDKNCVSIGLRPGPITESELPVCLVDNGLFKAAAVAYSERELKVFSDPTDARRKVWYQVPIERLLEASDLKFYLKR